MCVRMYSRCELYVCGHIHLSACAFFLQLFFCVYAFHAVTVCVCVWAAHSGSRADLVSHAEGLWSTRPTDHRIVALNGPQIIKEATPMERNVEADGRSTG